MKTYSIFEPPEIVPPSPITKAQYIKSRSMLRLYVVRQTYINLSTNYITYATSSLYGERELCDEATKKAFANTYLLILCMLEHGLDEIPVNTIGSIIGVSDKTMTRIINWLQKTFLVYVDNEAWKADVAKAMNGEKDIKFHPYRFQIDVEDYPDCCRFYPQYCQITANGQAGFDVDKPSRDPKQIAIEFENIPKSWEIYFDDWDGVLDSAQSIILKAHKEQLPNAPFVSPYSDLVLDVKKLRMVNNVTSRLRNGVIRWARNYHKAPVFNGGRWYHIFHQTPHELRGFILFNGSPLIEAFDLHNAYYTLLLFKLKGNILPAEYAKYRALVYTGKFYEDVQKKAGLQSRGEAKLFLQRYRNCTIKQIQAKAKTEPELGAIDMYFLTEFPEIRNYLDKYPRKNGSKLLQGDMCLVEWNVFQPICKMLHDTYNVTPFSLHDGIYLSEAENDLISSQVSWSAIEQTYIWSKV